MSKPKLLPIPTFTKIGVIDESDGKIVIFRLNITPEEWDMQSSSVKKILYISEAEKEEVYRYLNVDEITKKIIKSFAIANNALYFNDSSDFRSALSEICSVLQPEVFNEENNSSKHLYIDESNI